MKKYIRRWQKKATGYRYDPNSEAETQGVTVDTVNSKREN